MAEFLVTLGRLLGVPAIIEQYVIDPLKDQISYLCCSESILDSLRAKVERLKETVNNLQQDISAARQNLETIRPEVEDWLRRAAEIMEQTENFLRNISAEVQGGCINGICWNLKLHYSVSREAMKMAKAVDALGDGKFGRVADPEPTPGREIIPFHSGTEFYSRKTKEEEIMADLRDDSVYLIGICGMGGVGKTTMANKIWKRAKEEEKLFDVVAMAVVSQQLDEKGIQKQIAKYLGLELKEDETVSISAGRLRKRLGQEASILIIIDDIWEALNPVKLGIPSPREHKGCKIILTSRHHGVCTGTEAKFREMETTEMKATKIVSLDVLTENEAWALFKSKAGSIVDRGDLHQIAKNVAKECKGLPLALVTVGCALAETKAQENPRPAWEDALGQLQRSAPADIEEVLEKVYRPLEWSYNHLKSNEARYLFLLCSLFPEDSSISLKDLLDCGVGLRIFSNVETLREARSRVYALVGRLESRYMLMDAGTHEGFKCVKMHDVIRDVAIYIASKGEHVFMTSHGLKDWPRKDSYENYTHISLTLEKSVTLPDCINFPRLKMLRMDFHWYVQVPDTYFDSMRELNVLDIEYMGSLPSSLMSLTNLRTLRLRSGEMEDISMIGQLVKLEILDLNYSKLVELPTEIGGLENLKSLDLRRCFKLRLIAPGVISSLKRLEELFMSHSFKNWEADGEGEERRNASLVELASLKNLTALQLEIPDPNVLPQHTLHWPKLERFGIWIGTSPEGEDYGDNNLILGLKEAAPLDHALIRKAHRLKLKGMGVSDEVISLIQGENQIKWLSLEGCSNIKYLANILCEEDTVFEILRSLSVSNCRNLEVISFGRSTLVGSFAALEYLDLRDLCKLTYLWDQNICLPYLSRVSIRNCSSLQYVFLQSTAENLSRLERLVIEQCPVLEAVFKAKRGGTADAVDHIIFPKLTELRLKELPSLNSFCKAVNGIDFPQSKHLYIESSMEENSFFEQWEQNSDGQFLFSQEVFANLVEMELSNINATKIFSSQIIIDSFSQLERLRIDNCSNLKAIFSPPIFRNFRTLRELAVFNSSKLEEMVEEEDEKLQATVKEPLFLELKELRLSKLQNFKTFCHMKNDIELPQLESITIEDCDKMETFSVGSLSLPSLAYIFELLKPDLATRILFKKEVPRYEIHANSFTLFAKDLSGFEKYRSQLCLAKDSSDNFIVARLLIFGRLKISGRFEMVKLSPETLYVVVFEIKLEGSSFRCIGPIKLELTQSESKTQERLEDLEHLPREEWIEILVGKFTTGPDPFGNLEFSLSSNFIGGVLVKGVIIRPEA